MAEPAPALRPDLDDKPSIDASRPIGPEPLREVFVRCFRAACEWLAHTVLAMVIVGCNAAVEGALVFFAGTHDAKFFGVMPVTWIFHGADVGVLVGLSVYGVRAAIITYRGSRRSYE